MPIFIDSQKGTEYIPPYISADTLKSIKGIPYSRKIIKISSYEGFKKVKKTETVDNEGIYIDVPEYKRGRNILRIDYEMSTLDEVLESRYSLKTDDYRSYIHIVNFDLPIGYFSQQSSLLIKIPFDYPETPPGLNPKNGIYLIKGLNYQGNKLNCTNDYHDGCSHVDSETLRQMSELGWAWWCFAEMKEWNPRTDGLIQIFFILMETLQNPKKVIC